MHSLYPDYSSTNQMRSNGHLSASTGSGTGESMEITSHESSPDQDHSSNILRFRGRPVGVSQEHLRIFTYVLLGMLLGIIVVALFMDVSKSSKPASQEQQVVAKESKTHESNSTGAE